MNELAPLSCLILACALADRIRGGWRPRAWVRWLELPAKFGYGAMLAMLAGAPPWTWALISILWWVGEKPGWGYPTGWIARGSRPPGDAEWWQFGPLKDHPWPSLCVRGAMWGAPCLVLLPWWFAAWIFPAVGAMAMLAGACLERYLTPRVGGSAEFWRGACVAALIFSARF